MGVEADFEATIPGVPRAGERIDDKYEVETMLGEGAMGIVFLARHLKLGERVAIKVLKPEVVRASPTLVQRFLREARNAIAIQSAHVVRVMDVGTLSGGAPFMVMEYLEGTDLQTLLQQQGALPVTDACAYVLQACDALAEAHARGIVHRDLKPANLFLTRRFDGKPFIKVLDFGISKSMARDAVDHEASLTQTAAILGSPAYMSPEQVRNAKTVDGRADIWSLGIILYKLLVARSPFEGGTFSSLCAAIVADDPPKLRDTRPEIPAELEAITLRCLEKKPEARFSRVEDLAAALAPFASGEHVAEATVDAPPPSIVRREQAKTKHRVWIAGAAAAVVAGALVATRLWPHAEPNVPPAAPSHAPSAGSAIAPPSVVVESATPPTATPSSATPSATPSLSGRAPPKMKPALATTSASALQVPTAPPPPAATATAPDPLEHAQ